ncbi:MAG: DinB family protein [Gemmatimonadota bacterium]
MSTTATLFPARSSLELGPKAHYLEVSAHEHETTLRVLRAFPDEALELRPQEKCNTGRELAHVFVREQRLLMTALTTGIDWSSPPPEPPPVPETVAGIVEELETEWARVRTIVEGLDQDALAGMVEFMVAPKTRGDVPLLDFLWMVLYDEIHHRGQLSVYLRIAGGRLPSIYGPTADEPWL